jgi:hypothetical protein
MPRREELAFVVFAAWAVAGLFLDGWSHNRHKPETFFTPWHALLYSGIAAGVAWSVLEGRRYGRAGTTRPTVSGERLTTVGLALFGAAAVGDFLWHQAFGIERGVEALLSPTHLGLMTGGLLLTTGPLRAALATRAGGSPSLRRLLPVLASTATTAALAGFFLMYLSAFRGQVAGDAVATWGRGGVPEMGEILGIGAVLLTNALLVGAALVLVRSWRTPAGSLTLMLTAVALALSGLDGFNRVALVLAATVAGAAADLAVRLDRRRWVPVVIPAVLWPAWFAALALTGAMTWPANLWCGSVLLAVLGGVGLRVLAWPAAGVIAGRDRVDLGW